MSKTKPRSYDHVPDIEFARLAAWIDGEGCITIMKGKDNRRSRPYQCRIWVCQTNEGLMHWLSATFGGTYSAGTGGTNAKMYYWRMNGADMDSILVRCMPFFIVKREQARIMQEYRRTLGKGRTPLTPETLLKRETLRMQMHYAKRPWKKQPVSVEIPLLSEEIQ